ncbi:MAG: segregation/condensation protein A [Candidatus Eisenbacteria bacterium]|nr:segregation/condensation protein A [Candidatus Latescibacterota bacterium]MBD3302143.1 segregation/condensation protein A [Candidatus Eisenbacteria bacterium]
MPRRDAILRRNMQQPDWSTEVDGTQFRGHPIALEVFEGPLDLLLHLVQKDRIEIWEISISRITNQYLEYLRTLEALNVEIAGEFLVMAATLMRIKSRQLLPRPSIAGLEEDAPVMTREELIDRLLQFRRYKEAAARLRKLEEERRRRIPRGWTPELPKGHRYPLREANLVDLIHHLREVLDRETEEPPRHEVHVEEIRLEDRMKRILEKVEGRETPIGFRDLLERPWWRLEWIVTFLAILELMREGRVVVLQEEPFGDLWLQPGPSDPGSNGGKPALGEAAPAPHESASHPPVPDADRVEETLLGRGEADGS